MIDRFSTNASKNPWLTAAGVGSIAGGAANLFGNYNNPSNVADPYFEKESNELPQYFRPSIDAGNRATSRAEGAYGEMLDPNSLIKKIGAGYQESPGFKFARDQAQLGLNNAQAAGGMLGSPQHQQEAGQLSTNLANQDFYNYLKQALSTYGAGATGEQNLANLGTASSIGLGEDLAGITNARAANAYKGAQADNEHEQGGFGQILGGLSSLLPFFLG